MLMLVMMGKQREELSLQEKSNLCAQSRLYTKSRLYCGPKKIPCKVWGILMPVGKGQIPWCKMRIYICQWLKHGKQLNLPVGAVLRRALVLEQRQPSLFFFSLP